ncbi:MAG: NAD(P)H-binding protein [Myxococcota bacterium]|nr:NAD(P)H-binding protein [Myxococcota bacterium]
MILVTGATGRVGGNIVRMLRQAGNEVRCLVRMGSEYFWLNDTGATYFFGDLREPTSLKRAVSGCTYIIHVAGMSMESSDNHHAVTTLEGSENLFLAAKAEGVQHVVMVSCAGAGSDAPIAAFDCLARAEQSLRDSGLSHAILRPGPFLDDLAKVVRTVKNGKNIRFWASLDGRVRPVTTRDAAIYAIALLDHPLTVGQIVPIQGATEIRVGDVLERLCGEFEVSFESLRVTPGRAAARMQSLLLGRRWDNHIQELRERFSGNLNLNTEAWVEAVGIPLQDLETAIATVVAESHPSEDPTARDERVVHRQFQATVYEPGTIKETDLPQGPLRLI